MAGFSSLQTRICATTSSKEGQLSDGESEPSFLLPGTLVEGRWQPCSLRPFLPYADSATANQRHLSRPLPRQGLSIYAFLETGFPTETVRMRLPWAREIGSPF